MPAERRAQQPAGGHDGGASGRDHGGARFTQQTDGPRLSSSDTWVIPPSARRSLFVQDNDRLRPARNDAAVVGERRMPPGGQFRACGVVEDRAGREPRPRPGPGRASARRRGAARPSGSAHSSATCGGEKPKRSMPPQATKGSACTGLSALRVDVRAFGSPAERTTRPVRSATATDPKWMPSTVPPRVAMASGTCAGTARAARDTKAGTRRQKLPLSPMADRFPPRTAAPRRGSPVAP
jgi:hypothetical protein